MDVKKAYNSWAEQYDYNKNRTRDLEAVALRETLRLYSFDTCLEIGCGTGKNTEWLQKIAAEIVAVDFSEEMLARARKKISSENVAFKQADILKPWHFVAQKVDLVTFSLVLEHIENLEPILEKASGVLKPGGFLYIGELHPFKQYSGTKARFDTAEGQQIVPCYQHHVSDFIQAAHNNGLQLKDLREYFDDETEGLPRILTLLLQKE